MKRVVRISNVSAASELDFYNDFPKSQLDLVEIGEYVVVYNSLQHGVSIDRGTHCITLSEAKNCLNGSDESCAILQKVDDFTYQLIESNGHCPSRNIASELSIRVNSKKLIN